MITNIQLKIEKRLPFDADSIERLFAEKNLDVLRWSVSKVTDKEFIIDAAIIE